MNNIEIPVFNNGGTFYPLGHHVEQLLSPPLQATKKGDVLPINTTASILWIPNRKYP